MSNATTATLFTMRKQRDRLHKEHDKARKALLNTCKHALIAEEKYKSSAFGLYGGSYTPPWRMCLVCGYREQRDSCGARMKLWGRRRVWMVDNAFAEQNADVILDSLRQLAREIPFEKTAFYQLTTENF
jgi:hypothetical protein